jgi:hypothetical protein
VFIDGERGEIGLRVVLVMAVVAALAWTIPMVFFGRQETEQAAILTGAADQPDAGAAGASGEAPADPIGKANDVQAQANLQGAMGAAQVYYAENGSYEGFSAQVAGQYDPAIAYTSGAASPGVVSIRGVTPTTVVMVTATSKGFLCAGGTADVVSYGRADAQSPAQCSGGW